MNTNRHLTVLCGLCLAFLNLQGCRHLPWRPAAQPIPPAFTSMPTLDQLIAHINANSAAVQQLSTNGASFHMPGSGIPLLNVDLSLERPKNLRLIAKTSLTGTELDLGSNQELFWFWVKRNNPPAVFYAQHGQFRDSAAKQVFPVEPNWLIEAIGLVYFDPTDRHEGPYQKQGGQLEIRSMHTTSAGEQTKVTLIDPQGGWVIEQHLFDEQGALLASAIASQHQHDASTGVVLPHFVEIKMPPADLTFRLDVQSYAINRLYGDRTKLFTLPQLDGHEYVDLADPRLQFTPSSSSPAINSSRLPASGIPVTNQQGLPAPDSQMVPSASPTLTPAPNQPREYRPF